MKQAQTAEVKQSNDLRFSTSKTVGKETIFVKICLNDECKNGHQDFSITGDIYEAGKPKADRYFIAGGCIHEDIEKHFPEFKQFIDLHLCDYKGIPMHATANGFYHLRKGFNNIKPDDKKFRGKYCNYYRISPFQFEQLNQSENEIQFSIKLVALGILKQWEEQATKAIKTLEEMTGTKFVIDSKRTQLNFPTPQQIKEEEEKQKNGYYTPESKKQREEEKKQQQFAKLEEERQKELNKINTEYEVKRQVLQAGGKIALDNCIFYHHSNTLAFNWRSYDNLTTKQIEEITSRLTLPEGVKIETKKS